MRHNRDERVTDAAIAAAQRRFSREKSVFPGISE
jgi:hypothetical protein